MRQSNGLIATKKFSTFNFLMCNKMMGGFCVTAGINKFDKIIFYEISGD